MTEDLPRLPATDQQGQAVDRRAAFAAGPSRIPRRFVYSLLVAAVVLGLGGVLAERLASVLGLNPVATTTTVPSARVRPAPVVERATAVPGALASFMGLDKMTPGLAATFALTDERGRPFSLSAQRGDVVVLSFFDGRCNDICPVLAAELKEADTDLGPLRERVSLVTVNTDPGALAVSGLRAAAATGLSGLPNWHMVTGPLQEMDSVWRAYGITVNFDPSSRVVVHNDLLYILEPGGRFSYSATPFGDESRTTGRYSLGPADIARYARGIATYASRLVSPR